MQLIPPTILDMATSKKAVHLWAFVGLWLPATRTLTGLEETSMIWVTVAYCAYAIGQGMKDFGHELNLAIKSASSVKKQ